jgi:pimeloyl-ACP methyl ester carboxylesterase
MVAPTKLEGVMAFLTTAQGRTLAYEKTEGPGPTVVFLGGLKSDMQGTKAIHLEDWAIAKGRAFLRFDYSGHGVSSGAFTDGCIGDWAEDTGEALEKLTNGSLVLVGSSMGGWQALLAAKRIHERIAGLVTIAAFDAAQRVELKRAGQVALPSEYGEPYIITKRMIEDGRDQLVLRDTLDIPFPTRFLQGTADEDVDVSVALRLLSHANGADMRLTLVDGADHRFSDNACLDLIERSVEDVLKLAETSS